MRDLDLSQKLFGRLLSQWHTQSAGHSGFSDGNQADYYADEEMADLLRKIRRRQSIDQLLREIGLEPARREAIYNRLYDNSLEFSDRPGAMSGSVC